MTLIGHVHVRTDKPLSNSTWEEAKLEAMLMIERTAKRLGAWYPHQVRCVHDDPPFVRVTMEIPEEEDSGL